jgi:hypothetical protein
MRVWQRMEMGKQMTIVVSVPNSQPTCSHASSGVRDNTY